MVARVSGEEHACWPIRQNYSYLFMMLYFQLNCMHYFAQENEFRNQQTDENTCMTFRMYEKCKLLHVTFR